MKLYCCAFWWDDTNEVYILENDDVSLCVFKSEEECQEWFKEKEKEVLTDKGIEPSEYDEENGEIVFHEKITSKEI